MLVRDECTSSIKLEPMEPDSDQTLVTLAKAGEAWAYAELCSRHSIMALRVVNRIMRNSEDSEDVLQDARLKAFVHLASFDGRAKFSTWFVSIAVNTALMLLRKHRARQIQSVEELTEQQVYRCGILRGTCSTPESAAMQSQLTHRLREAIRKLPPPLRDVTELRHSADLSISEVAQLSGLTLSATKSRLLRARKQLAGRLNPADLRDTPENGRSAPRKIRVS